MDTPKESFCERINTKWQNSGAILKGPENKIKYSKYLTLIFDLFYVF